MSYTILPGVKQDHRGNLYRNAAYPNGKIITVPYAEKKSNYWWMKPVLVRSLSYEFAKGIIASTPNQQLKLDRVLESSPTYWSIEFFQRRA